MGKFNPIKVDSDTVSVEIFNRLQAAIQDAFAASDVQPIQVHPVTGQYKITDADQVLIADPQGGPVTVILSVPGKRQQVTVMNSSGTSNNPVTVVRIDGQSMGQSGTSLTVDKLKCATIACDTKDWFPLIPVE
jgi:hypothetical protein